MALLNTADAVYLGSTAATRVYQGANLIWPPYSLSLHAIEAPGATTSGATGITGTVSTDISLKTGEAALVITGFFSSNMHVEPFPVPIISSPGLTLTEVAMTRNTLQWGWAVRAGLLTASSDGTYTITVGASAADYTFGPNVIVYKVVSGAVRQWNVNFGDGATGAHTVTLGSAPDAGSTVVAFAWGDDLTGSVPDSGWTTISQNKVAYNGWHTMTGTGQTASWTTVAGSGTYKWAAGAFEIGAPIPPAPPSALIWAADYETNNFTQFASTPWNNVPTAPAITTTSRTGTYAGLYAVPSGGTRCENVPPSGVDEVYEDDELWLTFSCRLSSGFPGITEDKFNNIWQAKNSGDGSPPLQLTVRNGQWRVGGGYGHPDNSFTEDWQMFGTPAADTWYDWKFHIVFSSDNSVGYVECWLGGVKQFGPWYPAKGTLYPSQHSYWKFGYYRDSSITTAADVIIDDIAIYDSDPDA